MHTLRGPPREGGRPTLNIHSPTADKHSRAPLPPTSGCLPQGGFVFPVASPGITRFVEFGPGKVLSGLGKRILSDARNLPLEDSASLQNALDSIA